MFSSARPKRADLWYASADDVTLIIECAAADNSGIVEIGSKHIYASRKKRSLVSRRDECDLQVRIKRRSFVSEETAAKLSLSKDKIGELSFCPPSKEDEFSSAIPASLEAAVFMDDQLFTSITNTLHSGKRLEWLRLDIERKGTLGYGWEPDGSRIEWKIDNPSEPAYVDVTSIAMGLELFRT